jgi:ribose transport system substrate-binding protein
MNHKRFLLVVLVVALSWIVLPMGRMAVAKDTSQMRIALCNNYAGNSWRQSMILSFKEVAKEAESKGIIKEAKVFTTSENSATEQAALMQNLILEGYNAIVLNSASPTALNGACEAARKAGVIVVSFDGVVTAPSAWKIDFDYGDMIFDQMTYLNKRLNGKGNILEIRGIAGTSIDPNMHNGAIKGEKEYPGLKVVASVYGNWTQTVAQKAVASVLPTLPKIDGVITQGGDGYGCAMAFKAAGRPYPIICLGNRYDELMWWKKEKAATGYSTMSNCSPPSVSQLGLWTAIHILAGDDNVPKLLRPPFLRVSQDALDAWLKLTPPGGVARCYFSQDWTEKWLDAAKADKPAPEIPVPSMN